MANPESNYMSALAERGDGGACSTVRIPTGRFPVYSTTRRAVIEIGQRQAEAIFEAERDTLFTGLSVVPAGDLPIKFSAEYCNTRLVDWTISNVFGPCCERKPVFLMGVRDRKVLKFVARLMDGTPADAEIEVLFTLSGFQGNGCCG